MRRILALGCCAAYLVFGFVAGAAHVHESADHHEDMRGLHLDHAHLGESSDHGPAGHHEHGSSENGHVRVDVRHVGHHDGDALYLTATALRSLDSGLRVMPSIVSVGGTIDPPASSSIRSDELPGQRRGPPSNGPTRPRAPPA
jgi:hypothetical protein